MSIDGKSNLDMAYKAWRSKRVSQIILELWKTVALADGLSGGSGEQPETFCLAGMRNFTADIGQRNKPYIQHLKAGRSRRLIYLRLKLV